MRRFSLNSLPQTDCRRILLAAFLACASLSGAASAATYTWDGGLSHGNATTSDAWSMPNNWVGGASPVSSIDTDLIFTLSGLRTTATQDIVDPFFLHSLTFDANNTNFTTLSGGTLDFRNNSAAAGPTLTQSSAVAVTINNAMTLTNTLTVGGNGTGGLTLTGNIGGAGGLTKTGTGTVFLAGTNTFGGVTKISAGRLAIIDPTGLSSTSGIQFDGGGELLAVATTTLSKPLQINSISQTGVVSASPGATFTLTGALTTSSGSTVAVGSAGQTGIVVLSPSSITSGGPIFQVLVNAGTLRAGNSMLGSAEITQGVPVTVAAGATYDVNGFSGGSGNLQGGGTVTNSAAATSFTVQAGAFSGAIGGPILLVKSTTGNLTLTGSNTYTGSTTINGGTLQVDNNPIAAPATAGKLANTSSIAINNGGTLLLSGSRGTTDRINDAANVTIASGGTLSTGALSEGRSTVGSTSGIGALLTLNGGATIDFGTVGNGSTVLATSGLVSGAGTISILHWTGTALGDSGASTNDRLIFINNPSLSAAQLAQFQFSNDTGTSFAAGAAVIPYNGFFEVVPVPEPTTWLGGALAFGLLGLTCRKWRQQSRTIQA